MLIEFSVGNYRSFKDKVTFSMVAANIVAQDKQLDENNVFKVDSDLQLLKSAAIYGANASGKSNLCKAIHFMKWFMVNSSKETQSTDKIDVEHFRLSAETENQPSFFEIVFLLDGQKYRYGFEADNIRVVSEWLFYVPKSRETKLFERNKNKFSVSKSYKANGVSQKTRNNALFLSVSAQFNVEIAENILNWLTNKLEIISGLDELFYLRYTVQCLSKNENSNQIIELIRKLDFGINTIELEEREIPLSALPNYLSDEMKNRLSKNKNKVTFIKTIHRKFDSDGKYLSNESFDLSNHESKGTQKLFALAGLIFDTLKNGIVLFIDEFDASIHPLISYAIVELFNSSQTNPNNAQLIFMTHDTNLLSNKLFRKDQIWFTEKNKYGATDLYSLAEYKVRNDASFEKDYIQGRYGAIPYIGNLSHIIDSHA
jgi:AAA15 family ATPase/GTPase